MKKLVFSLLAVALLSTAAVAQKGTLRGTVFDDESGETIIGGNVIVDGTDIGTATDLDGNYSLELDPGTYAINFSFISFSTKKVTEVIIEDGKVTVIDVRLGVDAEELNEVVVTATQTKNTENALLTIQRKSVSVLDAVSSQSIRRTGDNDAASALQRVPGVSVEGGKYVYVRGLGDRYTKTIMNGMEIPGLDPDRNTVQMDIFPTNLVDNLIVYKTFSPDLPGDFTGGVVDIATKSFPDAMQFDVGASLGYNTNTTFNEDFILYRGGKTDWLGIDDGTRKLAFSYDSIIGIGLQINDDPSLTEVTRSLSPVLSAAREQAFLNQRYRIGYGNQFKGKKYTFGFNAGLTYSNSFQYYEEAEFGSYFHDPDPTAKRFDPEDITVQRGPLGQQSVIWSGLAGIALKTDRNKYSAQIFHTQNGEASATARTWNDTEAAQNGVTDILTYTQRSLTNFLLTGKHVLKDDSQEIEWKGGYTYSIMLEPDLRQMRFNITGTGDTVLSEGTGRARRIYRDLNEHTGNIKLDHTKKLTMFGGRDAKIKSGFYNVTKRRDFVTYELTINNRDAITSIDGGSADWFWEEENIWMPETNENGTFVTTTENASSNFTAISNVAAVYSMIELPIHARLKLVGGIRIEKSDIWYTGRRRFSSVAFENENIFNEIDFLPSAQFIYSLSENMNLRLSYSRTTARPSFKEKSAAIIFDPITEVRFNGNIDVEKTSIDNVDVRWEYFFNSGEMVSISGFFKNFKNPIEIVALNDRVTREVTPKNIDRAVVFGAEIELRKNFSFITEKLKNLAVVLNLTYVKSSIDFTEEELIARRRYEKEGETTATSRPMFGQSPFLINAGFNYTSREIGLTASLSYNVQGKRLAVVGIGRSPDVYEVPFHNLNLKISQRFGKTDQFSISFTARNLINDDRLKQYEAEYDVEPAVFSRLVPGRDFSIGFSYRLRATE